jgi:probable F420-dependent oxidoreductase
MKIGVVFPQTEYPPDPLAIRDYAQAVEGLGYSHMHAYDHVLGANPERPGGWTGPYTHKHAFFEPFVLFSYLAGLTNRIEFATGIMILPQRQTALVAKQAATLDVFCNGRLRLGVGNGWNEVEYVALGEDFHNRGRRMEEQVDLLRLLWTQPLVNFTGHYHDIQDAGLNPLPVQRPIPIWFGGTEDRVLQRMARMGDGWMLNFISLEQVQPALNKLDKYLKATGRDRQSFGIDLRLNLRVVGPEAWPGFIQTCEELGASHVTVNSMGMENDTPSKHLLALKSFAETIGLIT